MKIDNWIFMRGLVRDSRHWHNFSQYFSKSFPQSQLHFLDMPGIGKEAHRQSPSHIDDFVEDFKERWNQLRLSYGGNWGVVSISLGSMISLRWTDLYPENFSAQVIINTSSSQLSPPWQRLKPTVLLKLLQAQCQRTPAQREEFILNSTTNIIQDKKAMSEIMAAYSLPAQKMRGLALRQLRAAINFKCPDKITVPTLALLSKGDIFTDYRCTLAIAKHIGASVEIHPKAGHDLPLDDPQWICDRIEGWIKVL